MNANLSSFFEIQEKHIGKDVSDPAFRKATLNMLGALNVCQNSLNSLGLNNTASVSFVVATLFGEVSSSLEFLTTLHEQNIAKPILFQNSLHNSTLGFVSIQLGLQGPAFTLSADQKTDQAVSNTVNSLLHLTDHVLVCYVDIIPDYLKENYSIAFPDFEPHLGWARSFVISKNPVQNNLAKQIEVLDFNFTQYLKESKQGQPCSS